MCVFGGGGGAAKQQAALAQTQADEARSDADTKAASLQQGMSSINNAFAGFNDDYFNQLSKNYTDYAMPQEQDQYDLAKKNIVYSLARKGNLDSTVAGDQYGLLDKQAAQATTAIEGQGQDYANQARSSVQANKQDVIGQLNSSYDANAANTSALAAAKSLAVPQSFSPLGQLFTNVSALAAQNKLASDPFAGAYGTTGAKTYNPVTGQLVAA